MTVVLNFSSETEAILHERAARAGQRVEEYLQHWIESAVKPGTSAAVLAAVAAPPHVPAAWVDELEQLIEQGQRPPLREAPFAEGPAP